jgi:hypothetical protein
VEARATIKETSVSRFFVGAILVLVAMGLGAMGGYVVKGASVGSGNAAGTVQTTRVAPALPLRQDNDYPVKPAELPAYVQNDIDRAAEQTEPRLSQDDPAFIQKYASQQASDTSAIQAVKGGTRGDHGDLP